MMAIVSEKNHYRKDAGDACTMMSFLVRKMKRKTLEL
jgi:hypothetical protein